MNHGFQTGMIRGAETRLRKVTGFFVLAVAACAVAFVVIEGASSAVLFLHDGLFLPSPVFPRSYVIKYDELLGWTNTPNSVAEGTFGPGTRVTINSQSFRARTDYSLQVPSGKVRIICSGDSFTFGSEVSDEDTWCHQLTQIEPQLETINMGQGGYGVDQSYLRYKRDGRPFQHDIHLFVFITENFQRMRSNRFGFYGKPTVHVENGSLTVKDVPVIKHPYFVRVFLGLSSEISRLRSVELGKAVVRRVSDSSPQQGDVSDERVRSTALRVIEELYRLNREKQSVLVLVYLPIATDYFKADSNPWRRYFRSGVLDRAIPFVDVVEKFRSLPAEQVESLYVRPWNGHFSPKGNQYVAKVLHERLVAIPQIAEKLGKASIR